MKALSSFKLIYHLFAALLFNIKSVSKLGENFRTLSMVLKLKLEGMTWTAFQFFLRFDFCKIPKFRCRSTGKTDQIFQNTPQG